MVLRSLFVTVVLSCQWEKKKKCKFCPIKVYELSQV